MAVLLSYVIVYVVAAFSPIVCDGHIAVNDLGRELVGASFK